MTEKKEPDERRIEISQGNYNELIDGNYFQNTYYVNNQPPISPQEYRNRQALLNKVNNFWIKGVLERSLHSQVLINLGLEERPDAVVQPWNMVLQTPNEEPKPLPEGTKVVDLFDAIGAGRTLLILGEPGSGKTTTLLELTRDLILRAKQDDNLLIPVVLNLSSWANKRQKIEDWLVEELNSKYQVPIKVGQSLVKEDKLLLLLDGLDEVKDQYREQCITTLNQFNRNFCAEIVVCCRIKDHEALSNRLNFQSAVSLRSLTLEQVCRYLDLVGAELEGLRTLMGEDTALQELAKSPLMLNIMTLAYQGVAIEDLPKINAVEEQQKQLFDTYIEKMFKRRGANLLYSRAQAISWLMWLAKKMSQEKQTVFFIEQLQPIWLNTNFQRWVYRLIIILLSGTLTGVIFGFIIGSFDTLSNALLVGVSIGSIAGIFWGLFRENIVLSDSLIFSYKRIIQYVFFGLIVGCIIGIIIAIIYWSITKSYLEIWILQGLMFGVITGPALGVIISLSGSTIEKKSPLPNQGIWRSLRNAILLGLVGIIVVQLITGVLLPSLSKFGYQNGIYYLYLPHNIPIFTRILAGIAFGLYGAGEACIKHFVLRLFFYFSNCNPWNYARFLDYATNRIFLQKVGGGYIFIHRMLMEHFAQIEYKK